jgi:hypothetical protein
MLSGIARIIALLSAVAFLVWTGATPLAEAGLNEGLAAYAAKDYQRALRELLPAAAEGSAVAQYLVAFMYANAQGVTQDDAEAVKWYRRAAEQGYADAQHNLGAEAQYSLGVMYVHGRGVPQDDAEAVKWYRRAAEQGQADAQHSLGVMYGKGRGVPQDDAEAVKWYRRAAEQGYADAQHNLGVMYVKGQGVPQDYVAAHMWYNLAGAKQAPGPNRDLAVKNRDIVAKRMTPAQLAEAQRLAREWKPTPEQLAR